MPRYVALVLKLSFLAPNFVLVGKTESASGQYFSRIALTQIPTQTTLMAIFQMSSLTLNTKIIRHILIAFSHYEHTMDVLCLSLGSMLLFLS